MQLLPYFALFLTSFTLDKVIIHWLNMLEIDTNQKFKGSAVNYVLSILEVKWFFHILELWNTPKRLSTQICRNNSQSFEDMRSDVLQLPEDIIHHSRILLAESEKNANISECSALYVQREEGRSTRAMGKEQMATRDAYLMSLQAHRLSVHAKMIGGDFYDSMEIILSSLTFIHSQSQSQPWLKVVYQQFLFLNLNYMYNIATFVLFYFNYCPFVRQQWKIKLSMHLHVFSGDRSKVNIKTGERLF